MTRGETILWGGALLGGLYLLGRARAAPAQAPQLPPPPPVRPLPPMPRPTPLPAPERSRLEELLEEYVGDDSPRGGFFYQVQPQDTIDSVARAVLEAVGPTTDTMVRDYVYCLSSSSWNLTRYGSPSTSTKFSKDLLVPGIGMGVRAAFLPRNAHALKLLDSGIMPPRTVHERTAKGLTNDTNYGLLWLPPVSDGDLLEGTVTCAPFSWSDGSSTINPDPELLGLLEAAP